MLPKICSIPECGRSGRITRGMCVKHYNRWLTHGDPNKSLYIYGDDNERFWVKVDKNGAIPEHAQNLDKCWSWKASISSEGYGTFRLNGKIRKSHQVAYEMAHGKIKDGLDLDHVCRNRACVNPSHLRLVTNKENHENRGLDNSNTSGYRGACFHKASNKWSAYVTHGGKRIFGGYFATAREAGVAAKQIRLSLFTHNELDRSSQ